MKNTVTLLTLSALFSMAFLTACSSSSEKLDDAKKDVTEANEKLEEAEDAYLSDIEEYKKETAAKIAANEQMIAEFEVLSAKEKKANSAVYNQKVAELKTDNEAMKIKMDNYTAQGNDQWKEFKQEFNDDMLELGRALNEFSINRKSN
jgi:outer membrane biogenesis lipoprotein LolB